MKVVTSEQMREIDRRAIEDLGIPSIILMENAGIKTLVAMKGVYGEDLNSARLIISMFWWCFWEQKGT